MTVLRAELEVPPPPTAARPIDPTPAMAYGREFAASWAKAKPTTRAGLMQAAYAS